MSQTAFEIFEAKKNEAKGERPGLDFSNLSANGLKGLKGLDLQAILFGRHWKRLILSAQRAVDVMLMSC